MPLSLTKKTLKEILDHWFDQDDVHTIQIKALEDQFENIMDILDDQAALTSRIMKLIEKYTKKPCKSQCDSGDTSLTMDTSDESESDSDEWDIDSDESDSDSNESDSDSDESESDSEKSESDSDESDSDSGKSDSDSGKSDSNSDKSGSDSSDDSKTRSTDSDD